VNEGPRAALVAALFAVDPVGLGGVALRSSAGAAREHWLALLKNLLPAGTPWRRVPLHINDDRLLGGLDLAATLQAGRPVAQRGLLAEADGGIVLLAMAERLSAATAASIAAVIDTQELIAERHGIGVRSASRLGVVALDEGIADDEQMPARLRERLAFHLGLSANEADDALFTPQDVATARARFAQVRIDDDIFQGLCAASLALGIDSVRAPMLACRAARAAAALDGRDAANARDAALAAALVLAPRATQVPAASASSEEAADAEQDEPDDASEPPPPNEAEASAPESESDQPEAAGGAVDDVVLEAALASIPPGLLAMLALGHQKPTRAPSAGRAGAAKLGNARGRPTGVRRGEPQGGARLNVIETLRAAGRARGRGLAGPRARPAARASRCGARISTSGASSSAAKRRRCSSSMPPVRLRCIGSPRPRVRSNCCWPTAMCGATVSR
jgi:magnesium chelatase subunit D